jgi:hypothetical protein
MQRAGKEHGHQGVNTLVYAGVAAKSLLAPQSLSSKPKRVLPRQICLRAGLKATNMPVLKEEGGRFWQDRGGRNSPGGLKIA